MKRGRPKTYHGIAKRFDDREWDAYLLRIGQKLQAERLARDLSVEELAKAAGINFSVIYRLEKYLCSRDVPRRDVLLSTMFRLARAMDFTLYELLP